MHWSQQLHEHPQQLRTTGMKVPEADYSFV
jgi:hypothetical protein